MYEFPSASVILDPLPEVKKRGFPPTDPQALAGLFTPPGMRLVAALYSDLEIWVLRCVVMATIDGSAWGICLNRGLRRLRRWAMMWLLLNCDCDDLE